MIIKRRINYHRLNELAAPKSAQAVNQEINEEKYRPKKSYSSEYFLALAKPKTLSQRKCNSDFFISLRFSVFIEYQSNRPVEEFYTPSKSALLAQASERINQLAISRARQSSDHIIFDQNAYQVKKSLKVTLL